MRKWPQHQLKKYVDVKHGFAFKSEFFSNGGKYILLTPGNFKEEGGFKELAQKQKTYSGEIPCSYILKKDDLLIAMTEQAPGLLGSAILIPENNRYLHNQRLGLLRFNSSLVSKFFLFHVFNSNIVRKPISETSAGTKVKHTSPEKIGNLCIPIPPIEQQFAIASLISTWRLAIEKIEQLIAAKERYYLSFSKKILFGESTDTANTSKTTKWFSVPAHWKIVSIGKIANEVSIFNNSAENIPVLSCTKYDGLVDSLTYFNKQVFSLDTSTYKVVAKGQFAYATNHIEEGSIGYQDVYDKGLVSPMYTVFKTNENVDDSYLYKVLKSVVYLHIFRANTSSSVDRRGSLRWKEFAKLPIPLPPIEEQKQIAAILTTARQEIDLLKKQAEAYRRQKRGLMQKLLTGVWRVRVG